MCLCLCLSGSWWGFLAALGDAGFVGKSGRPLVLDSMLVHLYAISLVAAHPSCVTSWTPCSNAGVDVCMRLSVELQPPNPRLCRVKARC